MRDRRAGHVWLPLSAHRRLQRRNALLPAGMPRWQLVPDEQVIEKRRMRRLLQPVDGLAIEPDAAGQLLLGEHGVLAGGVHTVPDGPAAGGHPVGCSPFGGCGRYVDSITKKALRSMMTGGPIQALTCDFLLVGADGFEPPTSAL
ncbi:MULTISPECIES: hypothetical protein [unclassified Streptomyces]|uniref:hypothetical protein n=1 Tax=unclassified Streptomyces TaxID=2593676 RepID=UPI002B1CB025|nr:MULTISPECIES: hypothetical protein [unclassified Streptomyces]